MPQQVAAARPGLLLRFCTHQQPLITLHSPENLVGKLSDTSSLRLFTRSRAPFLALLLLAVISKERDHGLQFLRQSPAGAFLRC